VAKYMHGLDPAKYRSWLDAHSEILPVDAAGYPSEKTLRDWLAYAPQELRDQYEAAGAARRKVGAGADIGADLAPFEKTAREWMGRAPAANRAVFDRIMRDATGREGLEKAPKTASKRRDRRKRK